MTYISTYMYNALMVFAIAKSRYNMYFSYGICIVHVLLQEFIFLVTLCIPHVNMCSFVCIIFLVDLFCT